MLDDFETKIEPHHGRSFQPDAPEAIGALEEALRTALPGALVAILGRFGACGFAGSALVHPADGEELGIFTLFGAEEILKDYTAHADYAEMRFVPFADDEFNNRFVWNSVNKAVFFIDYSHGHGAVRFVAHSFDDFIDRITVRDD